MRPHELTVEGFRSYREKTTFDWRGRRLVGVVGPIGSGKSSIIDAISFALFGKTPAVERDTKSLIHQLCEQCHVELVFEVDRQVWRVQRALRSKGQAGHKLELRTEDGAEPDIPEVITGERAISERIERLLGMDFRAFSRSVLLAQNRFSEFLKATAGDRDKVLKGVFGYEVLDAAQRVARSRLDRLEVELDAFGVERRKIDEARGRLEEARANAASAAARLRSFEAVAPEVERLIKERETATADADACAERISSLNEVTDSLPDPDDVETARAAHADAQHAEMAHELRGALVAGEPCPVCDQPVQAVPKAGAAPKVAAAARAIAKAEAALEKARTAKERASQERASAATAADEAAKRVGESAANREQAADRLGAAEAAVAATNGQLGEWLGEGNPRTLLEARQAELDAAERAGQEARASVDASRAQLEQARESAVVSTKRLTSFANRLSGAWGRLGDDRDVAAEPEAVRDSFVSVRETVLERRAEAEERRGAASARAEAALSASGDLLASVGLSPGDDFRAELTKVGIGHGAAATEVATLEAEIGRANELEGRIVEAESRRDLARRLADDLKPSQFLAFLLEEERVELAELGSEHFEQLTDGAYRFADDGSFAVQDLNAAGTVRKADSLSGGETFLASLALALALAEMVARGGGRLDSFFLDEGFGSLDADHLDRAMDGIGRLVSENERRLVVLVSHVAEMRDAIEDLIVLDKHDVTGDTVVRSGAGPAV